MPQALDWPYGILDLGNNFLQKDWRLFKCVCHVRLFPFSPVLGIHDYGALSRERWSLA